MLVIDGVELVLTHQLQEMRKLEGRNPIRCQEISEATDEVIDIGHMGDHIVGDDQICAPAVFHQLSSQQSSEELLENLYALFPRRTRSARRRLDPKARDSPGSEVLE